LVTPEDRPVRDPNLLLSLRLLTFNHYVRKETYQWWSLLRQQIRRQTKCITSYRKQSFETRLSKRLLRRRDIFRLSLR
jgi:hypothetical protein